MRDDYFTLRTRTGKELHGSWPGTSQTMCGRWLRASSTLFKVADGLDAVTCETCLYEVARIRRAECSYCAPDEPCALHADTWMGAKGA